MNDKKLVVNNYDNGGSRMYFESDEEPYNLFDNNYRELIVDTFQDKEFSDYIEQCVREYYE